jgi:hypothetical protein
LARGGVASLAITGALQGGVLRPTAETKDTTKFFTERLQNAAIDTATLATMGGVNRALAPTMEGAGASPMARALNIGIKGFMSGAVGGVVGAEATARLKYGMPSTPEMRKEAIIYNGIFGAAMELAGEGITQVLERRNPGLHAAELTQAQRFENASLLDKMMNVDSRCSDEFTRQTRAAFENIHPSHLEQMQKAGTQIKLTRSIAHVFPDLADQPLPGSYSLTYKDLDGLYSIENRTLYLAEKGHEFFSWKTPANKPGIARHELGHAADHAYESHSTMRWMSSDPQFEAAHSADVAEIPWDWKKRLDYFIQSADPVRGRKEAFAELFAVLHGTGCHFGEARMMRRFFPRSLKAVSKLLQESLHPPK